MTKIFFIRDGKRIPFSEFLNEEKQKRCLRWRQMDELCDVHKVYAYVWRHSNGKPNSPTKSNFKKIISALGFSMNDFDIRGRLYKGSDRQTDEDYNKRICLVGMKY